MLLNNGSIAHVMQACKLESEQKDIATYLQPHARDAGTVDVCIVGCGPAGLALAAEVASHGRSVCLVGPESKFTNNYGVWVDEFRALGLDHLLDLVWNESICYFFDEEVSLPTTSHLAGLAGV
jgi:lycopene epsilon-cyclase